MRLPAQIRQQAETFAKQNDLELQFVLNALTWATRHERPVESFLTKETIHDYQEDLNRRAEARARQLRGMAQRSLHPKLRTEDNIQKLLDIVTHGTNANGLSIPKIRGQFAKEALKITLQGSKKA